MMTTYQANEEKNTLKWIGEAGTQSHHKLLTPSTQPRIRREFKTQSFLLRSKGFKPHIQHPSF